MVLLQLFHCSCLSNQIYFEKRWPGFSQDKLVMAKTVLESEVWVPTLRRDYQKVCTHKDFHSRFSSMYHSGNK
jgi:hypothetical protein